VKGAKEIPVGPVSVTQISAASTTGHIHEELGCTSERSEPRQPATTNSFSVTEPINTIIFSNAAVFSNRKMNYFPKRIISTAFSTRDTNSFST
jgi:hypothetical protein